MAGVEPGAGASRQIPPGWLGWNANLGGRVGWNQEPFAAAVAELRPGSLRFPGGSVGNYWDWRKGWPARGGEADIAFVRQMSRRRPRQPNLLPDFARIVIRTGAEPVWMLNLQTAELEEQLALLRTARDLGLPVRRVELGNELYFNLPDVRRRFPTVGDYGREAQRWAAAIRAEFPEACCAALAVGKDVSEDTTRHERMRTWNRGLAAHLSGLRALTVHCYAGGALDDRAMAIAQEEDWSVPDDRRARVGSTSWQEALARARREPEMAARVVAHARATANGVFAAGAAGVPEGLPLWVTEFNVSDRDPAGIAGTWAQALGCAAMTLEFLARPRVEMVNCHNLVGHLSYAALRPAAESGIPAMPTPLGGAMAFLAQALTGMATATPVASAGEAMAMRLAGPQEERIVVLNPRDTPLDLTAMEFSCGVVLRREGLHGEALQSDPPEIGPLATPVAPPRSLVVIVVRPGDPGKGP